MEASLTKQSYHRLRKALCFQRAYWPTALVMLIDAALLAAAFYLGTRENWWAYAAAQPLFVLVFFHNFAILHEAGHGNLSSRESINTLTGYYASIFCFLPYFPWKYIHAEHHTWAGNVEKDPTLKLVRDYEESQHIKNAILKFAWRSWLPLLALGQHVVFWTYPLGLLLQGRLQGQRLWRASSSVLLLVGVYTACYFLFPGYFHLRVFGPALFLYLVCVELVNFPHHLGAGLFDHTDHGHKLPLWEQSKVTRSCYYPPVLADLLLLNFNFHIEHHLFPDLPWYRLAQARELAKEALGEQYRESTGIEWNLKNRSKPLEDVVLRDHEGEGTHWNLQPQTPEPSPAITDQYDQLLNEIRLLGNEADPVSTHHSPSDVFSSRKYSSLSE